MKNFFQDAIRELDHVVWPTKAETKKYFTIVVSMISICALVLFVFGTAVTNALFAIRGVVAPAHVQQQDSGASDQRTQDILNRLKSLSGSTHTGATSSGTTSKPSTASGAVNPNK